MALNPFVKWAGGKRQLLTELTKLAPKKFKTYYEPFVGGGALLLELLPKHAVINDCNTELICVYKCLRNKKYYNKMILLCNEHEKNHSDDYYYQIRDLDRHLSYKKMPLYFKAARCLYLNKACYNGLFRVNSKGYFNVPSGQKETVKCFDRDNIQGVFDYFHKRRPIILCTDFANAVKTAKKGDFVYFDPPYDKIGNQSFTSYAKDNFGKEEQIRLCEIFKKLSDKGVLVMLSNVPTSLILELYKDFNIHYIKARRNINSKGNGRGEIDEIVITNY